MNAIKDCYIKSDSEWFRPIGADFMVKHYVARLKYKEVLPGHVVGNQKSIGYYSMCMLSSEDIENQQNEEQINSLKTAKDEKGLNDLRYILKNVLENDPILFSVTKVSPSVHDPFDGCSDERVFDEELNDYKFICDHDEEKQDTWFTSPKKAEESNEKYRKEHLVIKEDEGYFYIMGVDILIYNFDTEKYNKLKPGWKHCPHCGEEITYEVEEIVQ